MLTQSEVNSEVDNVLEQLIREYKPEKIILFGSVAKNSFKQDSDIDFFIIKEDVPNFGVERIRQLDEMIKYKLATDFIVYKPQEVKQRLKLGDPFIKGIFQEGKVLYEAS